MSSELFSLAGSTAVVAGAGGILGPVFSEGLAAAGANVALLDRAADDTLDAELNRRHGVLTLALGLDLRDPAAVTTAIDRIERELGAIDILHCNAATKGTDIAEFMRADEGYSEATWREVMSVNLDALFFFASAVGARMIRRGRGSVIFTGSIYGLVGPDERVYEGSDYLGGPIRTPAAYSASKAALVGLTRHLAAIWGKRGVRVNCLAPGGVESGQNEAFVRKYSARVPLGRMARREEMVGALVFLASPAATYVTGQVLAVDGGLTCW